MQARRGLFAAAFALASVPANAEVPAEAKASAIRDMIAGKVCVSETSHVRFGASAPGSSGTFERKGRLPGKYAVGSGTVLIERGETLHSHVAIVSNPGTPEAILHFNGERFRCAPQP